MKKNWHWLIYLDIILPVILFLLSYLLRSITLGTMLARVFHSYSIYIINPVPVLSSLTGVIGLILHAGAIVRSALGKDWLDLAICAVLAAVLVVIFATGFNYDIIKVLNF